MLFIFLLVFAGGPQSASPSANPADAALAARIDAWFHAVFAADDDSTQVAEARKLYEQRGIVTAREVGELPAYEFVVVLANDKLPSEFRSRVLSGVKEAAARSDLPPDAATFYEAKLKIDMAKAEAEAHPPSNPALRDEIERLYKADQAVRGQGFDLKKMEETDRRHAAPLQAILDRYGAPTYSMVGPEAAGEFVTMIQHQPAHFRREALPKLKASVAVGQADPQSYALVYDRSQGDVGKKQLYGENFVCNPGEKLHMAPVEDRPYLNQRRAEFGLVRIEVYERILAETMPQVCAPAPVKK